jgi:flagellar protein FlaG
MATGTQPVGAPTGAFPLETHGAGQQKAKAVHQRRVISEAEIAAMVKELNTTMKFVNTNLSFSYDSVTKKTVVTVTDAQTHEVIRQIPSEEMLKMSQRITELLGVLFDHAV